MMKTNKNHMTFRFAALLLLLSLLASVFCFTLPAVAAPDEETEETSGEETEAETEYPYMHDLEYLTDWEGGDLIVRVEWETEEPIVIFVSPDYEEFNPREEKEGTQVSRSGKALYYLISDAAEGKWMIRHDDLSNKTIKVMVTGSDEMFAVENLTARADGDRCRFSFDLIADEDFSFTYEIYLGTDVGGIGTLIGEASAYTNTTVENYFDLDAFGTYDRYVLYVRAYYYNGTVDIWDDAYSAPFSYQNGSQPRTDTNGLLLEIHPDSCAAIFRWEPESRYSYLPAFFAKTVREEGKPASYADEADYFEEITDTDVTSFRYSYGTAEAIRAEFSERGYYDSGYSVPISAEVDLTSLPKIVFEERDTTNRRTVSFTPEGFPDRTLLTVSDGTGTTTVFPENGTTVEVEIPEGETTVSVRFAVEEGIEVVYEKTIFRDTIPPLIYMAEDYSDVTTENETYIITGTVTDAVTFTIGGTTVTPAADGKFSFEAKLSEGRNVLDAVASDVLGNSALYTVVITRLGGSPVIEDIVDDALGNPPRTLTAMLNGAAGVGKYAVGIASLTIALILGILFTVSAAQEKKGKKTDICLILHRILAVPGVVGLGTAAYQFIQWRRFNAFNTEVGFVDIVNSSVERAYGLLRTEQTYKKAFLICAIATAAILALIALVMFVIRPLLKKRSGAGSGDENPGTTEQ